MATIKQKFLTNDNQIFYPISDINSIYDKDGNSLSSYLDEDLSMAFYGVPGIKPTSQNRFSFTTNLATKTATINRVISNSNINNIDEEILYIPYKYIDENNNYYQVTSIELKISPPGDISYAFYLPNTITNVSGSLGENAVYYFAKTLNIEGPQIIKPWINYSTSIKDNTFIWENYFELTLSGLNGTPQTISIDNSILGIKNADPYSSNNKQILFIPLEYSISIINSEGYIRNDGSLAYDQNNNRYNLESFGGFHNGDKIFGHINFIATKSNVH